jgi:hypothetical protein
MLKKIKDSIREGINRLQIKNSLNYHTQLARCEMPLVHLLQKKRKEIMETYSIHSPHIFLPKNYLHRRLVPHITE